MLQPLVEAGLVHEPHAAGASTRMEERLNRGCWQPANAAFHLFLFCIVLGVVGLISWHDVLRCVLGDDIHRPDGKLA